MRAARALPLGWLTLGVVSCSDPSSSAGPVLLEAHSPEYQNGAVVELTIRNLSAERLQYSACFPRLEKQGAAESWTTVHEDASPCPAVLEYMNGYTSRVAQLSLPGVLPAGTYRVRFPLIGATRDEEPFVVAVQVGGAFGLNKREADLSRRLPE